MQDYSDPPSDAFVRWMREVAPYLRAHRGQTFVVYAGGDVVASPRFADFAQDLALVSGAGVRLVVVHGARPQIEQRLRAHGIGSRYVGKFRITDAAALDHVVAATGATRVHIESKFSLAAINGPLAANRMRIAGGNFLVARPLGIVDGQDLCFTGTVRRVDVDAIQARLAGGELVLLSPLGYSPTGEIFNLGGLEVATEVAAELGAAKLVVMIDSAGLTDDAGRFIRQLTVREAGTLASTSQPTEFTAAALACALRACAAGVERVHLISHAIDGALLRELFTRDGVGTLLSNTPFDQVRSATIDDVGGILGLIEPFEQQGILVKRSREKLEMEIERFTVLIREGTAVACGALYPYAACGAGEIACIAVHPEYHKRGFGDALLAALEQSAAHAGLRQVFVLTTRATHWFLERGYAPAGLEQLPVERQSLYNYQRNSAVLIKRLA